MILSPRVSKRCERANYTNITWDIIYRLTCHVIRSHKGGARSYIVSNTKLRQQGHITQAGSTRSIHAFIYGVNSYFV